MKLDLNRVTGQIFEKWIILYQESFVWISLPWLLFFMFRKFKLLLEKILKIESYLEKLGKIQFAETLQHNHENTPSDIFCSHTKNSVQHFLHDLKERVRFFSPHIALSGLTRVSFVQKVMEVRYHNKWSWLILWAESQPEFLKISLCA